MFRARLASSSDPRLESYRRRNRSLQVVSPAIWTEWGQDTRNLSFWNIGQSCNWIIVFAAVIRSACDGRVADLPELSAVSVGGLELER